MTGRTLNHTSSNANAQSWFRVWFSLPVSPNFGCICFPRNDSFHLPGSRYLSFALCPLPFHSFVIPMDKQIVEPCLYILTLISCLKYIRCLWVAFLKVRRRGRYSMPLKYPIMPKGLPKQHKPIGSHHRRHCVFDVLLAHAQ